MKLAWLEANKSSLFLKFSPAPIPAASRKIVLGKRCPGAGGLKGRGDLSADRTALGSYHRARQVYGNGASGQGPPWWRG